MRFGVFCLIICLLWIRLDALCTFPTDLRGEWLSSKKGNVTFTSTDLFGYHPCKYPAFCPPSLPDHWTCWDSLGDRYVIRTDNFSDSGSSGRIYSCLYLYRLTNEKYLVYQGPNASKGSPFFDHVISVSVKGAELFVHDLCDLKTNPHPAVRHNLLIKSGFIDSARSTCPSEILGNFQLSDQCNATMDACADRKNILLQNATCTPPVFYSENGELSCIHSIASDSATFVTVYNHDVNVSENTTFRFICLAVVQIDTQILILPSPNECSNVNQASNISSMFTLETNYLCPFSCNFSSSLVGTWLSSRKGQVVISDEYLSGFEPIGDDCTTCSSLPTDFQCYIRSGSRYLIRSARTVIAGEFVRIYVCLDFNMDIPTKVIYYQAHDSKHTSLDDYLQVLNAATSVDSMDSICVSNNSYGAELHSVLIKSGTTDSSVSVCPSDLHALYNSTQGPCAYTLSTCSNRNQIQLSKNTCKYLAPSTVDGRHKCIYSISSGRNTFLTVASSEDRDHSTSTIVFSCIAFQKVGSVLMFTQALKGCHAGQNATHVSRGFSFTFHYVDECPTDEDLYWIAVVVAMCIIVIAVLLMWIFFRNRCRRRCRQRKGTKDEENIVGSNNAHDDNAEFRRSTDKKDRRESQNKKSMGAAAADELWEHSVGVLGITFREGIDTPMTRSEKEFQIKHRLRQEDVDVQEEEDQQIQDEDKGVAKVDDEMSVAVDNVGHEATSDRNNNDYVSDVPIGQETNNRSQENKKADARLSRWGPHGSEKLENDSDITDPGSETFTDSASDQVDREVKKELSTTATDDEVYSNDFGSCVSSASSMSGCSVQQEQSANFKGKTRPIDILTKNIEEQDLDSKNNLHLSRAWTVRTNNPQLVQDGSNPLLRQEYEFQDHRRSSLGIPTERQASFKKVIDKASKQKKRRAVTARKQSFSSFRETRRKRSFPAGMKKIARSRRVLKGRSSDLVEIPFYGQYYRFTKTRDQLDDDGVWDDQEGQVRTSEAQFGFTELESQLREDNTKTRGKKDLIDGQLLPDFKVHRSAERRVSPSPLSDVPRSLVELKKDETELLSSPSSNDVTQPDRIRGGNKVIEYNIAAACSNGDPIRRFCARLQEMKDARKEIKASESTAVDGGLINQHRKRVSTAVRRLLSERLLSWDASSPRNRSTGNHNSGGRKATIAPEIASWSKKSNIKHRKKKVAENQKHVSRMLGRRVKIVPAREKSKVNGIDTSGSRHGNTGTIGLKDNRTDSVNEMPYNRRFPLGALKHSHVTSMYCPPIVDKRKMNQFPRIQQENGSKWSQTVFKSGQHAVNRCDTGGLPTKQFEANNGLADSNTSTTKLETMDTWRRGRPDHTWTYNLPSNSVHHSRMAKIDVLPSSNQTKIPYNDDLHLRRLLEELYRDKKYMDKVISATARDRTEVDVWLKLKTGRDYLLQRAHYWLEKGPLPPRPPVTDLGLRLQKAQTTLKMKNQQQSLQTEANTTPTLTQSPLTPITTTTPV